MSRLKHKAISKWAAAAIPVGMAAVFAFQATASAAPATGTRITAAAVHSAAQNSSAQASGAKHKHKKSWRPKLMRVRAYYWALSQKGHPYSYGGTGPGYDCSGLVMMAYRHAGIHLPRTTYEMLDSPLLVKTDHPRTGDLAFYGTGHVELFRKWGYTYGAHDSGTVVSLIHYGWGWKPTAYYRVRIPVRHRKHHKHKKKK
jgi:cell wall-associated NlpC family hydrolase